NRYIVGRTTANSLPNLSAMIKPVRSPRLTDLHPIVESLRAHVDAPLGHVQLGVDVNRHARISDVHPHAHDTRYGRVNRHTDLLQCSNAGSRPGTHAVSRQRGRSRERRPASRLVTGLSR